MKSLLSIDKSQIIDDPSKGRHTRTDGNLLI